MPDQKPQIEDFPHGGQVTGNLGKGPHLHTVLCDYLLTDTNYKHSYMGIFSKIYVETYPGSIPQFYIVSALRWWAIRGNRLEFLIVDPTSPWQFRAAQFTLPADYQSNTLGDFDAGAVNVSVHNLEFPHPGEYHVWVSLNGKVVGGTTFKVGPREKLDARSAG